MTSSKNYVFLIKKGLCYSFDYSHNGELPKRSHVVKISVQSENCTEYCFHIKECFDMFFSTPKLILQAQNKR